MNSGVIRSSSDKQLGSPYRLDCEWDDDWSDTLITKNKVRRLLSVCWEEVWSSSLSTPLLFSLDVDAAGILEKVEAAPLSASSLAFGEAHGVESSARGVRDILRNEEKKEVGYGFRELSFIPDNSYSYLAYLREASVFAAPAGVGTQVRGMYS